MPLPDEIVECGWCNNNDDCRYFPFKDRFEHKCFNGFDRNLVYDPTTNKVYPLDAESGTILKYDPSNFKHTMEPEESQGKVKSNKKKDFKLMTVEEILNSCEEDKGQDLDEYIGSLDVEDEDSVSTDSKEYDVNGDEDADTQSQKSDQSWSAELNVEDLITELKAKHAITQEELLTKAQNATSDVEQDQFIQQAEKDNEKFEQMIDDMRCQNADGWKILKLGKVETNLWPRESILDMLCEYNANKSKRNCWESVLQILKKNGYKYDMRQIKRKFSELLSHFKKIKNYNDQSGNDPLLDWPYYDIFEKICGKDANIKPIAPCSSINPKCKNTSQDEIESEKGEPNRNVDETPAVKKQIPKKRMLSDDENDENEKLDIKTKKPTQITKKRNASDADKQWRDLYLSQNEQNRSCIRDVTNCMSKTVLLAVKELVKSKSSKKEDKAEEEVDVD